MSIKDMRDDQYVRSVQNAEVAELADAQASGACGSNTVRVQVPPSALVFQDERKMDLNFIRSACQHNKCGSGGIGRRAGFRCLW